MRQIILDTETTGLDPKSGHRIIEIGALEIINRRITGNNFHQYINPEREVELGALQVHGITNEFLADKPLFSEVADKFYQYIEGAELIIHNAPFDVGFINHEFSLLNPPLTEVTAYCKILDTLELARKLHPGQKNSLDALCKRYQVDNSGRKFHGALLDADLLAEVYLAMTGGQISLAFDLESMASSDNTISVSQNISLTVKPRERKPLPIFYASEEEIQLHTKWMEELNG